MQIGLKKLKSHAFLLLKTGDSSTWEYHALSTCTHTFWLAGVAAMEPTFSVND